MKSYGLKVTNATNLQDGPAKISQSGAFTVVDKTTEHLCIEVDWCVNLDIQDFTFYLLGGWRYRLIRWLARKL